MDLARPATETPVPLTQHLTMSSRQAATILLGRVINETEVVRIFTDDAGDLHLLIHQKGA